MRLQMMHSHQLTETDRLPSPYGKYTPNSKDIVAMSLKPIQKIKRSIQTSHKREKLQPKNEPVRRFRQHT